MPKRDKNRAKFASNPAIDKEIAHGENAAIKDAAKPTFGENIFLPIRYKSKIIPNPDITESKRTPNPPGPKRATKGMEK